MRSIEAGTQFALLVAAGVAALCGLVFLGTAMLVPKSVENGRAIDQAFLEASQFIEKEIAESGNSPSDTAFNNWKAGRSVWVTNISLISSPKLLPSDVKSKFGEMPTKGYALSVWRGEWTEYFVSWRRESTVDSAAGLYASSLGLGLASALLAFFIWRIRRAIQHANPPRKLSENAA